MKLHCFRQQELLRSTEIV